ncbi:hypothetical protein [Flavobacterium sp.]|uniref:hypothetical protein n=1 Tax=Flavobacterium sp. TaxID=239 RepID=UPI0039E34B89
MQLRNSLIEQIEQFLDDRILSIASVCFFMQSIRILLEIDQSSAKYKITSHYCNWLLHKELKRSNSPQIIQEIADSFETYISKNDLIKGISDAISLKKLIIELQEILWINVRNKKIVSQMDFEEYWLGFLQIILNQLKYRPLKLKANNINLDGLQFSIYGLQIVVGEHYNIELLSKELELKNKRFLVDIALFPEE